MMLIIIKKMQIIIKVSWSQMHLHVCECDGILLKVPTTQIVEQIYLRCRILSRIDPLDISRIFRVIRDENL